MRLDMSGTTEDWPREESAVACRDATDVAQVRVIHLICPLGAASRWHRRRLEAMQRRSLRVDSRIRGANRSKRRLLCTQMLLIGKVPGSLAHEVALKPAAALPSHGSGGKLLQSIGPFSHVGSG